MRIFKVGYEIFGESQCIMNSEIESYDSLEDLINKDENLKDFVNDKEEDLEEGEQLTTDEILDYYNTDNEVLRICRFAESEEDFISSNLLTTMEDLKNNWVEDNTIYAFRNYQYSKNTLLAKFEGFKDITEVKSYCIDKNINLSEFSCATSDFVNVYFLSWEDKEKFDLEDLNAIYSAEDIDVYSK